MPETDILIKMDKGVFSYRVAGILIQNGMVLLQRPPEETGYAFPGGQVNFGETSQEALIREYREEIGAEISPIRLLWVAENFFPWEEGRCHQICFYYLASLSDAKQVPSNGSFLMTDEMEQKIINLEFSWIPLSDLDTVEVYPVDARERLAKLPEHTEHFIYVE